MKKLALISTALLAGLTIGLSCSHSKCFKLHLENYSLRQDLKDIYGQSRLYEKNGMFGAVIPAKNWEELKTKAKNTRQKIKENNIQLSLKCK